MKSLMLWSVLLSLSGLSSSFGQTNLANISGVVTDAQSAAIANATATAANVATGVKTATRTNDAGFYLIRNLPIGSYVLGVEKEGFRRYVREGITLVTGQALGLDVQLQVGAVTESVTVNATSTLLQTRTSDVGQVVEYNSIRDLPLGDRRLFNIIAFSAAAVFVNYDGNLKPNFSLAGGRTQSQMAWIDGGTGQNMRLGVAQIDVDPPADYVQEVKVLANSYPAEYGGSAGGVIVVNTKSGTNQFHGSTTEYVRNDKLDAPGFFAPVADGVKTKPPLRYNVFGGTLGGPIRRNKTFFFIGYERSLRRTGSTDTLTVPTALQRAGDFSQTFNAAGALIPIYDPLTTTTDAGRTVRTAYPGNRIPAGQLDPVAVKLMPFYPNPNRAADNLAGANNFKANFVVGNNRNNTIGKIDHYLGSKDKFVGRYMYNSDNNANTSVYPEPAADGRTDSPKHYQYWFGSWNRTVSPTLLNEFRFTYANRLVWFTTKGLGGNWPEKIGLTGVANTAFPQFSPAGFTSLGAGGAQRRQAPSSQHQFVDNFSWIHDKHSLKFGGEARRSTNYEVNQPTPSGSFGFATTGTGLPGVSTSGNGLASMMAGFVNNFASLATPLLDRRSWYLAAFVQDDWTASKDLTLNIGLRWETDTPIRDTNGRMNGFDFGAINPVSGTPGVVKFLGVNGFPSKPFPTDWNNFGPRFGFAWRPFGAAKTVVRGAFGIAFAHPTDSAVPNSASLGYEVSSSRSTPDNGVTPAFYVRNGVPVSPTSPVLNDSFGAVPVGSAVTTAVNIYDPSHRSGYAEQFNLGIERELWAGTKMEVSYVANMGRKLAGNAVNINQILPQILGPGRSSQVNRPFPQFNNVNINIPAWGVSSYHSGFLRFEKRYANGFNVVGSYTFSKFLQNTSDGGGNLGNNPTYSDFYNRHADWGPQGNDIRHHLAFSSVYELPLGSGKRYVAKHPIRYLIGGWAFGNVTTIQSGPPFTVTTQTNNSNAFSAGGQRANVLRDPNLPVDQRTVARWFDTSAFTQPAIYQFGNSSPGVLRGDGIINFDFSILRNFQIREQWRLQFRAEMFNISNHTNFGGPNTTFGNASFGIVSGARAARQIQLGLRLTF